MLFSPPFGFIFFRVRFPQLLTYLQSLPAAPGTVTVHVESFARSDPQVNRSRHPDYFAAGTPRPIGRLSKISWLLPRILQNSALLTSDTKFENSRKRSAAEVC